MTISTKFYHVTQTPLMVFGHNMVSVTYLTQLRFTCSKSTMEAPEQCETYSKFTIKTPERRY